MVTYMFSTRWHAVANHCINKCCGKNWKAKEPKRSAKTWNRALASVSHTYQQQQQRKNNNIM
eukprot:1544943-Karenia_brevis.AAC.1